MKTIHVFNQGRLEEQQGETVREFPVVLHVNGREIATLISSPHDLRFLVAGFLRLQGFVTSLDDFHMLSVCEDFGTASVRIKGELPERLKPVLTSGCGTGITFNLPNAGLRTVPRAPAPVTADTIFRLMDELNHRSDQYKSHGGIHSAAVGDDRGIILAAEDIGRHNTLDRIAGEALIKNIDLTGKLLVTSGRISTEMAAKAALLGITLMASRTSPTDMAITICEQAGITLIGYVRGGKFTVYSHPEALSAGACRPVPHQGRTIPGVTGVILAGGQSSRMRSNKALLPYKGGRFIEAIYRQLTELFDEVILVTNTPDEYAFLPCRKVPDLYPGMGALAGLHAGLHHSATPHIFAVACDMPYLNSALIRRLAALRDRADVIIPEGEGGLEPLHALYGKGCQDEMERSLKGGSRRIVSFFPHARVSVFSRDEVMAFDPSLDSFRNINTPADYFELRDGEREAGNQGAPLAAQAG
ncbi:formate dehydrogenase accessory sulfurtransferase FdhD [Geobacter sp. AOG2]|uniref:formate dehydrogenase accessory sulfurtransferase FdhD n=1 Tax=Geobacter sp. AOG2 TaxID=1566347 RepID=UPI001CC6131F|nr:formate dehydrogenase accessory sulfurtransferase FdhD [Geobacter sp. AOG2]GFE61791.1 molybdenum cofactor guanylyltransferase [Geobacter sp. AOG2]